MKRIISFSLILSLIILSGCSEKKVSVPGPYGALPTKRQIAHQQLEMYAFLHFTTNTFTDLEWGYGDESPEVFNPTEFDPGQIISTLAQSGFKGAILTCKHHDGFCLWPSKYTKHSVKNSLWENGNGDVVKAISEACKKHGIKFGVYLSPWDRNHAEYGQPEYIDYYRNQMKELLTNYGEVFELWVDGANGGDGYYGGAMEKRNINRANYYQWDSTFAFAHKLQADINIFSDIGPDLRWIGNERGYANDSCWATYTPLAKDGEAKPKPGLLKHWLGETGTINGKYWIPAEVDVSIRPDWFYHPAQDDKVKTLEQLVDIYFNSVGKGTTLNLNIPPDRRGKIHENDVKVLTDFKNYLDKAFSKNILTGAKVSASEFRGNSRQFNALNTIDNNNETYWSTNDSIITASIEFELNREDEFNCLEIQEYTQLGQRVTSFSIEVFENNEWKTVAKSSTIGYKKLLRFDTISASKIRINILNALACPLINKIGLYNIHEL